MKKLLLMLAVITSATMFTACSDKSDEPVDTQAEFYKFSLRFADTDLDSDQAEIITTTYSYEDNNGNTIEGEFLDHILDEHTIQSLAYTKIPGELEIVITQTLNPDVELTKDVYHVGLTYELSVKSYAKDQDAILDMEKFGVEDESSIKAEKLSSAYPMTTRLRISVSKNGEIKINGN